MGVGNIFVNGRLSGWALFPASRKAEQNLKQNLYECNGELTNSEHLGGQDLGEEESS